MSYSIPLEFRLAERETPAADAASGSATKRGKIKEDTLHTNRWLSTWIPWDDHMDLTTFLRNLQRELAAVGLAATRDVERNVRARIDEYKIFSGDISNTMLTEGNITASAKSGSLSGAASAAGSSVGPVSINGSPSSSVRRSKRRRGRGGGGGGFDDDDDDLLEDPEADDNDDDDDEPYSAKKSTSQRGRKRKQPNYSAMTRPSSSSLYSGNNKNNATSASPGAAAAAASSATIGAAEQHQSPGGKKLKFQCATCEGPLKPGIQTCPQCGSDAMPKPGSLGKGKKLCRSCKAVLASFRRECTYCHVPCGKGD